MKKVFFYIKERKAEDNYEEEGGQLFPLIDIFENEGKIHIQFELPGINADDLDLSLQDNEITLKVFKTDETTDKGNISFLRMERKFGWLKRRVKLPVSCDSNNVKAFYSKGVLTVILKKIENKRGLVKKITID